MGPKEKEQGEEKEAHTPVGTGGSGSGNGPASAASVTPALVWAADQGLVRKLTWACCSLLLCWATTFPATPAAQLGL